jgi:hypothetical protein
LIPKFELLPFTSAAKMTPAMAENEYSKCECEHCGGHIEFPTGSVGAAVNCPHCGNPTTLRVGPRSRKTRVLIGIIIAMLAVIGASSFFAVKSKRDRERAEPDPKARSESSQTTRPEEPGKVLNQFRITKVRIEKPEKSSLVYVLGSVKNLANHQRFGVKIDLDLLDAAGGKMGTATDYTSVIEQDHEWHFKALVTERDIVSAEVSEVSETK